MNADLKVLIDSESIGPLAQSDGFGLVGNDGAANSILDGTLRFVPSKNYALAFAALWNMFSKTLLDSYSGVSVFDYCLARRMRC